MKIIFFGTPDFAAKTLEYLVEKQVQIAAVVTQPDRPKGRSLQMSPSPVKIFAEKKNIKIFQPEKASSPEFLDELMAIKADLFIVVAFGQILSQKLLNIPPLGCINVHASLLPKYRGAAPIQRAIMAGEKETGIAIQKMVKQLDAGDVIIEKRVQISEDMIFDELEQLLVETTKPLLLHVIKEFEKGVPPATPQNHDLATYASKIDFSEGEIHWQEPSIKIHNLIRAFSSKPGAWCWIETNGVKKRLKILRSKHLDINGIPGELLSKECVIGCKSGSLQLLEVQPEGKKPMKALDWLRGQKSIRFK